MKETNAYQITWIEIKADNDRQVNKSDLRKIERFAKNDPDTHCVYLQFNNRAEAIAYIEQLQKKVYSKSYSIRLFTDAQFSSRIDNEGHKVEFTKMQRQEVYHLYTSLTYDVHFDSDTCSDSEGFKSSYQECRDYIDSYNGTNNSYFPDYRGGTVSVVCNETGLTIYNDIIK